MSRCDSECNKGRGCPIDQGLTDAIFVGALYAITIAGMVAIAWAVAYTITNI